MDLFVREYGPPEAPTVVFLHGGYMSGWSWEPVVKRMQGYRCLVPDLPPYGKSFDQGPFEIGPSAAAVAEVIRSRSKTGRAHLVGFSLGAQVGVHLLATDSGVIDRAVLSGTAINKMANIRLMQLLLRRFAKTMWFQWAIKRHWNTRGVGIPTAKINDYREDARRITGAQLSHIVVASAGFNIPAGLAKSDAPTLFLTGENEMALTRRCAARLAQSMPNGIDMTAFNMRHDWPLRYPDVFSRTVCSWLSHTALPSEVGARNRGG